MNAIMHIYITGGSETIVRSHHVIIWGNLFNTSSWKLCSPGTFEVTTSYKLQNV